MHFFVVEDCSHDVIVGRSEPHFDEKIKLTDQIPVLSTELEKWGSGVFSFWFASCSLPHFPGSKIRLECVELIDPNTVLVELTRGRLPVMKFLPQCTLFAVIIFFIELEPPLFYKNKNGYKSLH